MRTFAARLTLRVALLVTALTAASFAASGWILQHQIISGMELLHDGETRELAELLGTDSSLSDAEIAARIGRDAKSDAALFFIQVHDEKGLVRFRSVNLGSVMLPDLTGLDPHSTVNLPSLGRLRVTERQLHPWHIQVGTALSPLEGVMTDYVRVAVVVVLCIAGIAVGCGYFLSRVTLQPVRAIEQAARRISFDNLGERIPVPETRDELAGLALLLNQTFDRLRVAFDQVRRFTADASHELKTPLALVRLNVEKLRPALQQDAEASATLNEVLEEVGRINQVLENLLFLSRTEGNAMVLNGRPIDLAAFFADLSEDAHALAQDRDRRFEFSGAAEGSLVGDSGLLRQLFLNLLVNAFAAMPSGGLSTLRVERRLETWTFTITDEGPGLPDDMLERVFERFVRHAPSDGTELPRPGHGLGLSICRAIAQLHGGTIQLKNRSDRSGLQAIVELPAGPR